jgi:F-type H+-transporting ATPase subunit b
MNPLVVVEPGLYIWAILVFLLLLVAFNYLAWKPLKATLQSREDSIRKSLDDARQAREELQRLRGESAKMLTEARAEADTILQRTREDANRFRDEMKEKAQAEAATIVKNAEKRIEMETSRALLQIRAEAVEFSVAIASKILQRNVSREDNERLIEETFRQIETTRPSWSDEAPPPDCSNRGGARRDSPFRVRHRQRRLGQRRHRYQPRRLGIHPDPGAVRAAVRRPGGRLASLHAAACPPLARTGVHRAPVG